MRFVLELGNGEATLIDESYNANPASMAAALNVLGQAEVSARGRRIAVLGDMLELGTAGVELHRGLSDAGAFRQDARPRAQWVGSAELT